MGTKSDLYLYEYRLTNTWTNQVYQSRGWSKVITLAGLKGVNISTLRKVKKWKIEVISEPEIWDEATYRQSLYARSKDKYSGYELKKKERDPLFETRKRLRLQNHRNYDGTQFTAEQHEKMLKDKCAICGDDNKVVVDHCHSTGFVRGTLCNKCNLALGFLDDSKTKMQQMIKYIEQFELKKDEICVREK